ncbi:MAG: 8-oxoguanine deaminase [Acidimicrobiia bacterium]|nr:8-oxoguanine deaminase [Acidimicrobiia bacterium]
MTTLLIKNATVLVTMDGDRREISGGGLFARDGWIEQVGTSDELPDSADEVVDLFGHVVLPGMVNTHHHLYQTLTRAVPAAQDAGLFGWLTTLYPIWARMTPDHVRVSTTIGLAELALSGCTTTSDHLYLYPNGSRVDDQVEGADGVGIRFHIARGSMSLGESDGGLPPDSVVESEADILTDTERVISEFHDPEPGAHTRIVVAPCSPFSVTPSGMEEAAALAREHGLQLHTHLAETMDEEAFCIEQFGLRPVELAESVNWMGPDVWFAHSVFINDAEISRMGEAGTGVAHCPTSNMRLASGIAPIAAYRAAGVNVGLGVDGSASNDGSHLLAEARQAMLLARLGAAPDLARSPDLMTARTALELATRGGAAVLGRDDIGSLEVGKAADFIALDLNRLEYAGAHHDPVGAILFCAPTNVDHSYVHGRAVVLDRELVGIELPPVIEQHNRLAAALTA